jgi:hypothetical protein
VKQEKTGTEDSQSPPYQREAEPTNKLFEEIALGTAEARNYMEGKRYGYKVTPAASKN